MSQDDREPKPAAANVSASGDTPPTMDETSQILPPAEEPSSTPLNAETPAAKPDENPEDTVGTGTSIALGCVAGTILLIIIGLIFLGIAALF